jgi:hypothetical protein
MLDMQVFLQTFDKRKNSLALAARFRERNAAQMFEFGFPEMSGAVKRAGDGAGGVE